MNAGVVIASAREFLRSRAGRALVLSILAVLLSVQFVILGPLLSWVRQEQILRVTNTEIARIDALLQALPADWALEHLHRRPLLLGLVIRDPKGRVAASSGFTGFALADLRGPGKKSMDGDGFLDLAFDVERRDGTWRVMIRCYTQPTEIQTRQQVMGLALLAVVSAMLAAALMVTVLRRSVMRPLEHQALHDSLTDLPNRAHFDKRLSDVIFTCLKERGSAALLYIDLDRFKVFNDNFGHPQGDALLIEIARRLQSAVAADCVAARLGGDEFAVILPYVRTAADARAQAENILEIVSQPYRYNQFHFQLSASIGVAMLPEHGANLSSAQRNADIAMYVAKRAGRARVTVFDAAMRDAVSRRKDVEDWLRTALDHDELRVHYQPKISVAGRSVEGAEALLRWTRPNGLVISPGEFIPVAEECGLIVPLGRWVLTRVLAQIAEWRREGFIAPRISVNVSANQFRDEAFLESFLQTLGDDAAAGPLLDLEITESALITAPEHTVTVLNALRERGITVSLDDFGTGYSSLGYLKRFPVNTIKIDKGFVSDLATDVASARLVKAVIRMTHSLGLTFVAEGVETMEQLELLRGWGCDLYQGHVSSPAIDPVAFREFCASRRPAVEVVPA